MPFTFKRLAIPDMVLIEPEIFKDKRGIFMETYKYSYFARFGIKESFVQDNCSRSFKNVLRGLHFQNNPMAQGKLVWCPNGRVFDVAVDLRKNLHTFRQWISVELSEENNLMLYIPPGFAHGFVVLSDFAEVIYKCTEEYSPEHDKGISWDDPDINIQWPVKEPILSEKDTVYPRLKDVDTGFIFKETG